MSMWIGITLWAVASAFVIGVTVWSLRILFQQKKAWASFAKKHGLSYEKSKFMESPRVGGFFGGRKVALYGTSRPTADARRQRFVTVIEVEMGPGTPAAAAFGTAEFSDFLESLIFKQPYRPEGVDWKEGWRVVAAEADALKAYMTPARIKALHNVFSMSGAAVLFFFDDFDSVLRVETSDPLRSEEKVDKIIRQFVKVADILAPTNEEKSRARKDPPPVANPAG